MSKSEAIIQSDTDVLSEVAAFRQTARAIVRASGLDDRARTLAIARVADLLRGAHPWSRKAVWLETAEFLTGEPAPFETPSPPHDDPTERRLRLMRLQGFERCDSCGRPVPSWEQLRHWEQLRRWIAEEKARREAAA